MSVVIGIKEKGVVYLGADSQASSGSHKFISINKNNFNSSMDTSGIIFGRGKPEKEMGISYGK